jgi:protein ImuB
LERLSLPAEVSAIEMHAAATAALACRQAEFFAAEAARGDRGEVEILIERLSSRLGRQAVVAPRLVPDAQPEYAVRYEAWVGQPASSAGSAPRPGRRRAAHAHSLDTLEERTQQSSPLWFPEWELPLFRPPHLRAEPVRVDVMSAFPDGPPGWLHWQNRKHVVLRSWGPERIETGWWRHPLVRRDYFRVELQTGQHVWLFRLLDRRAWFLHGEFC